MPMPGEQKKRFDIPFGVPNLLSPDAEHPLMYVWRIHLDSLGRFPVSRGSLAIHDCGMIRGGCSRHGRV